MKKNNFSSDTMVLLCVADYPWYFSVFGLISMAVFNIPLYFNNQIRFFKLMGCGKNGSFDVQPDLKKWALMVFFKPQSNSSCFGPAKKMLSPGTFIQCWYRLFRAKMTCFQLQPFNGHGSWDGFSFEKSNESLPETKEMVAVLTRASIRLSKVFDFWKAVPAASKNLGEQKGLKFTIGIGEIPFIKQATFSIWESTEDLKNYAYRQNEHKNVIQRTRKEKWYSEEMFIRFRIIKEFST